ncbi:MAG: TlpA disulfide reductase family protein [Bacteroidota bacterium]
MRITLLFFAFLLTISCIFSQNDCFAPIVHDFDPRKMGKEEMQEYFQKLHDAQQELVGCEAPNFTAKTLPGDTIELHELRGKIVVLNFWFIACPPCIAELPGLKQLADEFGAREDVVLLALATDEKAALDKFVAKREVGFTILPETRSVADAFRITGYPTTFVLDKEGNVFSVHIGGATNERQASKLIYKAIQKDIKKNS